MRLTARGVGTTSRGLRDLKVGTRVFAEGPYGAKGVGEPALIATAPAILGAIRHATGARITRVSSLRSGAFMAVSDEAWEDRDYRECSGLPFAAS